MAKYDMHKVHFYESIYIGIKSARSMYKINTKELSLRMGYSVNHFARMERDNCEIILSQAFKICSALNISFVKLILLSNCLDFFTDSKGVFISLSELKKRYPEFNLQLLHA
jgi:transcriptional regulator with XRE-family HTH domain